MEKDKIPTLLEFMIQHNEAHLDEIADLLDDLPPKAQKKLLRAIGTFETANVELQAVLEELKDEMEED